MVIKNRMSTRLKIRKYSETKRQRNLEILQTHKVTDTLIYWYNQLLTLSSVCNDCDCEMQFFGVSQGWGRDRIKPWLQRRQQRSHQRRARSSRGKLFQHFSQSREMEVSPIFVGSWILFKKNCIVVLGKFWKVLEMRCRLIRIKRFFSSKINDIWMNDDVH